jgi:hypothetical protein
MERALSVHGAWQAVTVPDAARSLSAYRWHKIYTSGGKTTHDTRPTHCYTRTLKGTVVSGSSPEQSLARWWCSVLRKETPVKKVGNGVLLLHKQEEDIRN